MEIDSSNDHLGVDTRTLGEVLRDARQQKKLSIQGVENATSIRLTYLQAIEDNTIDGLISPVYAKGFISQYANYLGLDPQNLLNNHNHVLSKAAKQEFDYGIGTLERRNNMGSGGIRWLPNLMYVGSTVFILICGWYLAKSLGVV